MKVAVIGLGLIGGSFAKTIKGKSRHSVLGYDIDARVLEEAKRTGAIDEVLDIKSCFDCDLVLAALFPGDTIEFLTRHAAKIRPGCLVVDTCGVKLKVCEALWPIAKAHGFHFIGGHPMAGIERFGFFNSSGSLFENASMILTPGENTPQMALTRLEEFFAGLGFGGVHITTPEIHDKTIAYTSQLAHVLSSAYVKIKEAETHRGFSAGSFGDMTRVARLNEVMWSELFLENRDFLLEKIEELSHYLNEFADAIAKNDREGLRALLKDGRLRKETIDSEV
jgi:prephenate dehydrogenase